MPLRSFCKLMIPSFPAHCQLLFGSICSMLTAHRTIYIPLPTHRLASSALKALQVDEELSSLVRRSFFLVKESEPRTSSRLKSTGDNVNGVPVNLEDLTVLKTVYHATTNRMLRVAVNGFMESLGVVLGVMEELDLDVLAEAPKT